MRRPEGAPEEEQFVATSDSCDSLFRDSSGPLAATQGFHPGTICLDQKSPQK